MVVIPVVLSCHVMVQDMLHARTHNIMWAFCKINAYANASGNSFKNISAAVVCHLFYSINQSTRPPHFTLDRYACASLK